MASVKKVRELFYGSNVACTVVPLQVAPTELQGANSPMRIAKITRPDFDAGPCSQGYDQRADGALSPRQPAHTVQPIMVREPCKSVNYDGVLPPKMPAHRGDRPTKKNYIPFSLWEASPTPIEAASFGNPSHIHCHKIRTPGATGLRKQRKKRTNINHPE
jgi:hypothetical protein